MSVQIYWPIYFTLGVYGLILYRDARRKKESLRSGVLSCLLAFFILIVSQKIIMKNVPANFSVQSVIMWMTVVSVAGVLLLGFSPYATQKEQQFNRKIYRLFSLGLIPTFVLMQFLSGLAVLIPLGLFALMMGYYYFRHHTFDSETHRFILK